MLRTKDRTELRCYLLLAILYVLIMMLTEPETHGDTPQYVAEVVSVVQADHGVGADSLWEFGHVIWRPSGWLAYLAVGSLVRPLVGSNPGRVVNAIFSAISLCSGLGVILVAYSIGRALGLSRGLATLLGLGIVSTNSVLNWAHTGSSYVPGLMAQLIGIRLLANAAQSQPLAGPRAYTAGIALGISVCLWFPYILSLPGMLLFAYCGMDAPLSLRGDPERERLAEPSARGRALSLCKVALALFLTGVMLYAPGAVAKKIYSVQAFKAWVSDSAHGVSQTMGIVRIATGVPRTFLNLGDHGIGLKRLYLKDPYAQAALRDVLNTVWKILLVYLFLVVLAWKLWTSRVGRRLLWPLLFVAIPIAFFAIALFEPSGSERYMPGYAMGLVATAWALRDSPVPQWDRAMLWILLPAMLVVNLPAYRVGSGMEQFSPDIARIRVIKAALRPNSRVMVLSFRDGIERFYARYPFDPLHLGSRLPLAEVVEIGSTGAARWRQECATIALETWQHGGDFWISSRLLAERPLSSWGWVEGDGPHAKWTDIRTFFGRFDIDSSVGEPDGFVRVAPSAGNTRLLRGELSGP